MSDVVVGLLVLVLGWAGGAAYMAAVNQGELRSLRRMVNQEVQWNIDRQDQVLKTFRSMLDDLANIRQRIKELERKNDA